MMTDPDTRRPSGPTFIGPNLPERPILRLGLPIAEWKSVARDGVEAELRALPAVRMRWKSSCSRTAFGCAAKVHRPVMNGATERKGGKCRRCVLAQFFSRLPVSMRIGKRSHRGGTILTLSIDTGSRR